MSEATERAANFVGIEVSVASITGVRHNGQDAFDTETAPFDSSVGTVPQVVDFISKLKQKFGSFDRIGVAVPGLIRSDTGRVAFSANIPGTIRRSILRTTSRQ